MGVFVWNEAKQQEGNRAGRVSSCTVCLPLCEYSHLDRPIVCAQQGTMHWNIEFNLLTS